MFLTFDSARRKAQQTDELAAAGPGRGQRLMSTATLDSPVSEKTARPSGAQPPEEAMYVAVTWAWSLLVSWEQRRNHPLEPYVLGPHFVWSMIEAQLDARLVASVCAKLARRYPWERDSSEPAPLPGPPVGPSDPLSTWWRALGHPDGLGLHYDELAGGVFEFLSVGGHMDRPPPGFRRQ